MKATALILLACTLTLTAYLGYAIATNLTDRPTSPTWEITLIQPDYNIVMIYMDHDTTGYRDMLPGATVKFERVVQ